jgi:hypothetical protein
MHPERVVIAKVSAVVAQLIALITLVVEQKINLALKRIFFLLSTWKKRFF